jgi:[NiFe] hydrogenase diaphorase moiety large subunit
MKDNMAETQESVIREICGRFGNEPTRLMDILLQAHRRLGSVSGQAVDAIARAVSLPRVEVESTLSFYAFFSPKPRGRFVIRLCNDIIDQMRGADRVGRAFREELGIDFGQTTADGLFTLEHTPCIGMCDQAPAALINDKVVTNLSSDRARELVEELRASGDVEHLKLTLGNGNNSHPLVRPWSGTTCASAARWFSRPWPAARLCARPWRKAPPRSSRTSRFRVCAGAGARASPPA